jgi:hypothetical protein
VKVKLRGVSGGFTFENLRSKKSSFVFSKCLNVSYNFYGKFTIS